MNKLGVFQFIYLRTTDFSSSNSTYRKSYAQFQPEYVPFKKMFRQSCQTLTTNSLLIYFFSTSYDRENASFFICRTDITMSISQFAPNR